MCMRKCVLHFGEKIFHVLVILGFIAGAVSAVLTAMSGQDATLGGKILTGLAQLVLSWSGTLIIALVVYSLLDIKNSLCKENCNTECKK